MFVGLFAQTRVSVCRPVCSENAIRTPAHCAAPADTPLPPAQCTQRALKTRNAGRLRVASCIVGMCEGHGDPGAQLRVRWELLRAVGRRAIERVGIMGSAVGRPSGCAPSARQPE